MKNLLSIVFLALILFTSCQNDEAQKEISNTEIQYDLVGKWSIDSIEETKQGESLESDLWNCIDFNYDYVTACGVPLEFDYTIQGRSIVYTNGNHTFHMDIIEMADGLMQAEVSKENSVNLIAYVKLE